MHSFLVQLKKVIIYEELHSEPAVFWGAGCYIRKYFFVKESRSYDVQMFSKIMLSSHYAIGIKEQKHHCSLFITARSQKVPKLLVAVARADETYCGKLTGALPKVSPNPGNLSSGFA